MYISVYLRMCADELVGFGDINAVLSDWQMKVINQRRRSVNPVTLRACAQKHSHTQTHTRALAGFYV